jgi:hypothetical protein
MKIYSITFIISALILTACSSTQTTNMNTTNSAVSANTANAQFANAVEIEKKLQTLPPTEVLRSFFTAVENKDVITAKKSLSKDSFVLLEQSAKAENITVDEYLEELSALKVGNDVEIRNEKILGDTATVDYKDSTMPELRSLPFVREEGIWKLSLNKLAEQTQKEYTEDMKKTPTKSANANKAK